MTNREFIFEKLADTKAPEAIVKAALDLYNMAYKFDLFLESEFDPDDEFYLRAIFFLFDNSHDSNDYLNYLIPNDYRCNDKKSFMDVGFSYYYKGKKGPNIARMNFNEQGYHDLFSREILPLNFFTWYRIYSDVFTIPWNENYTGSELLKSTDELEQYLNSLLSEEEHMLYTSRIGRFLKFYYKEPVLVIREKAVIITRVISRNIDPKIMEYMKS